MLYANRSTNKPKSLVSSIIEASQISFSDDFTTDKSWISSNTLHISRDEIAHNIFINSNTVNGIANSIVKDLQSADALNGVNASDTAWLYRFSHNTTQFNQAGGSSIKSVFGLSDLDETVTNIQDFIGFRSQVELALNKYELVGTDSNSVFDDLSGTFTISKPSIQMLYPVIIRNSATAFSVDFKLNSDWTNTQEIKSGITASTNKNHRYIKSIQLDRTIGTPTEDIRQDDVEFYDGITTVP